ncbi:hypothetical protein [Cytobacillus sp. NCCP-133]|uniref:hypothetical protein n=1 Tax=Cytobacillus sp. NCCP-133 TaxID=766848 RepID=UPI0022316D7C|nr:hypothetical protein [Cytobacillus sp. NCCP-133]GLB58658.1 hypothetical protein NCCP133_07910 [Cytobacillus sp. NCCP-133]
MALGNIQNRSKETKTEREWRLFGEELRKEHTGFTFQKGTSNSSDNGIKEHTEARESTFDFVFKFKEWDTQVYDKIPNFKKGNFTGNLKGWMWDYNYQLNVEVKQVGRGNLASVMPGRFMKAFNIPYQDRNKWLIVDFSNVLKLRNFGGIIYVFEDGEEQVHHIFGSMIVEDACIGEYHFDWEGDPTEVGGGAYKAKTLLDKNFSLKFKSFEEVKQYIRKVAKCKLEKEKQLNRNLFKNNLDSKKTSIIEYSENKVGEVRPVIYTDGYLEPAPKQHIDCEEVSVLE